VETCLDTFLKCFHFIRNHLTQAERKAPKMTENQPQKLLVLWTSGDKETAMNMVFMYTLNSRLKGWWEEVTLLIWGGSGKLLAGDEEARTQIAKMQEGGVEVIACRRCAEIQGIVEELEALGIRVFYTGQFLTDWIKSREGMITI
jgi:hypothetical protein